MEVFNKAKVVRLRSHHDKYLLADADEESVSQERNGQVKNARWTVEVLDQPGVVRLRSCYGKYLTASNMPFLLGMTGKKVLQTLPKRLDSSVEWEPLSDGVQVRLRTRYGQYLRANGGLPPWRNSITHDVPHRTATLDWVLWDVDVMAFRKGSAATATIQPSSVPSPKPEEADKGDDESGSHSCSSTGFCVRPILTKQSHDATKSSAKRVAGRMLHSKGSGR